MTRTEPIVLPRAAASVPRGAWVRVAAAIFAIAWGGNEFTPLLVMYKQDDHLSAVTVDALLAVYVFGIVPAMLIGAPLSDRFGRRPLMVPAAFIAAAGSLVLAFADSQPVLLGIGRVLSGVALGLAMAIGTAWVKELSQSAARVGSHPGTSPETAGTSPEMPGTSPEAFGTSPERAESSPQRDSAATTTAQAAPSTPTTPTTPATISDAAGRGAARGALALTAGFLLGAVVAAPLSQWGPWPQTLPYLIAAAIAIAAGIAAAPTPETRTRRRNDTRPTPRELLRDLRIPAAGHRRFLLVVLPMGSWIFGTAASAYAVLPTLLAARVPGEQIAFSGLLCTITLGTAFAVQPLARRFHSDNSARGVVVALAVTVVGMLVASAATATLSPAIALAAAAVLGVANGLLLLGGMLEVQRIARDDDLAGLTAVLYTTAYVGFFIPTLLSLLSRWVPYPVLFVAGAIIASGCLATVARFGTRHLYRHGERPART